MVSAFPVALTSESMTTLSHHVLRATGLEKVIPVAVLGETVPRGTPAPDTYLEAARRLEIVPGCARSRNWKRSSPYPPRDRRVTLQHAQARRAVRSIHAANASTNFRKNSRVPSFASLPLPSSRFPAFARYSSGCWSTGM